MSIWVIAGLLAVFVVVVLVLRLGSNKEKPKSPVAAGVNTRGAGKSTAPRPGVPVAGSNKPAFHGEVFVAGENPCMAAQALNRKTFEKGKGAAVPLPQCDNAKACGCHLRDTEERRHGERRIAVDRRTDVRFADERRSGRDRRKGVDAWTRTDV